MTVIPFKKSEVVTVLEEALERAKAGEFSFVNVSWVVAGKKRVGGEYSCTDDTFLAYTTIKYAERHYAAVAFGDPLED